MTARQAAAMRRLARLKLLKEHRDEWIREAYQLGISPTEIHRLSGVSRAHIYTILERSKVA